MDDKDVRRRNHDSKLQSNVDTIHTILDKYTMLDAGQEKEPQEPLKLSTLTVNPAVETTYRDRKGQEHELEAWIESVRRRETDLNAMANGDALGVVMNDSDDGKRHVVGGGTTSFDSTAQGYNASHEFVSGMLDQVRDAVKSLQVYGTRVMRHSKALAEREMSLEDFNQKMHREMSGLGQVLKDGQPTTSQTQAITRIDSRRGRAPPQQQQQQQLVPSAGVRLEPTNTDEAFVNTQKRLIAELESTIDSQRGLIDDLTYQLRLKEVDIEELRENIDSLEEDLSAAGVRNRRLIPKISRGTTVWGLHDTATASTQTTDVFRVPASSAGSLPSVDPDKVYTDLMVQIHPHTWRSDLFRLFREAKEKREQASRGFGLLRFRTPTPLLWSQYAVVQLLNAYSKQYATLLARYKKSQFSVRCFRYSLKHAKLRLKEEASSAMVKLQRAGSKQQAKKEMALARSIEESKALANTVHHLAVKLKAAEARLESWNESAPSPSGHSSQAGDEDRDKKAEADGNQLEDQLNTTNRSSTKASGTASRGPSMAPVADALNLFVSTSKRFHQGALQRLVKQANAAQRLTDLTPAGSSEEDHAKVQEQWKLYDKDRVSIDNLNLDLETCGVRMLKIQHPLMPELQEQIEQLLARAEEVQGELNRTIQRPAPPTKQPSSVSLKRPEPHNAVPSPPDRMSPATTANSTLHSSASGRALTSNNSMRQNSESQASSRSPTPLAASASVDQALVSTLDDISIGIQSSQPGSTRPLVSPTQKEVSSAVILRPTGHTPKAAHSSSTSRNVKEAAVSDAEARGQHTPLSGFNEDDEEGERVGPWVPPRASAPTSVTTGTRDALDSTGTSEILSATQKLTEQEDNINSQRSFLHATATSLMTTFSSFHDQSLEGIADLISHAVHDANAGLNVGTDIERTARAMRAASPTTQSGGSASRPNSSLAMSESSGLDPSITMFSAAFTEKDLPKTRKRTRDCGTQCARAGSAGRRSPRKVSPVMQYINSPKSSGSPRRKSPSTNYGIHPAPMTFVKPNRAAYSRENERDYSPVVRRTSPSLFKEMIARQEKAVVLEDIASHRDELFAARAQEVLLEAKRLSVRGVDAVPHHFPVYPEVPVVAATIQTRDKVKDHPSLRPAPVNYGRPKLQRPQSARVYSAGEQQSVAASKHHLEGRSTFVRDGHGGNQVQSVTPRKGNPANKRIGTTTRRQPFVVPKPPPPPVNMNSNFGE